jgi:hypothetical protein
VVEETEAEEEDVDSVGWGRGRLRSFSAMGESSVIGSSFLPRGRIFRKAVGNSMFMVLQLMAVGNERMGEIEFLADC